MAQSRPVGLGWLVQLRWWTLIAWALAVVTTEPAGPVPYVLLGLVALSNVALLALRRRVADPRAVGAVLVVDTLLLTVLLHLTGGPMNPFTAIYFVYITMAALLLSTRWILALFVASVAGFGSLFAIDQGGHHMHGMGDHLRGMWLAFGVTAILVGLFVTRLRREVARRDEELEEARERAATSRKVAALTSLAAGAAHELGTPIGTIALAAGELERGLADRDLPAETLEDVRLIREEVKRCRQILGGLSTMAGEVPGEAMAPVSLGELVDRTLSRLPEGRIRAEVERAQTAELPAAALELALRSLLQNALDAGEGAVELNGHVEGETVHFEVRDHGRGMSAETLRRSAEPFFSTKDEHGGMGLGLFLVNAVAEQLGGELELTSDEGAGTIARLSLPRRLAGSAA